MEAIGLTIGQVAEMVGFSQSTLLRWEREGLIPKPARRPSGWRVYTERDIARIQEYIDENYEDKPQ